MRPVPGRITAGKSKQAHCSAEGEQRLRGSVLPHESKRHNQKQEGGRKAHSALFPAVGTAYTETPTDAAGAGARPMAFANFVLKVDTGDLGPSAEGTPVFAVRIDDARLEYYDPAKEGRSNKLRHLLAAALAEDDPALAPEKARNEADERIRDAHGTLDIARWRAKIMESLNVNSSDAKRLSEFLATIATPRSRAEYYVDYELTFMGISARSLIHRRMQQRCPTPAPAGAPAAVSG